MSSSYRLSIVVFSLSLLAGCGQDAESCGSAATSENSQNATGGSGAGDRLIPETDGCSADTSKQGPNCIINQFTGECES